MLALDYNELPLSKSQMRRKRMPRGVKVLSPRQERKKLIKTLDTLWSLIIRGRDKACQWCGKTEHLQAHHIISKTRLQRIGNQNGRWAAINGVTLCRGCHLYKLKDYPDEYDTWMRKWIDSRGWKFECLLALMSAKGKADLKLVKIDLEQQLKGIDAQKANVQAEYECGVKVTV